jgi:ribosomal protein L22
MSNSSYQLVQAIHSARANAAHNHGLDPDKLIVGKLLIENVLLPYVLFF